MFDWRGRYRKWFVDSPVLGAIFVLALFAGSLPGLSKLELDASADTLVLEGDDDLAYFRRLSNEYGTRGFAIVTFQPREGDIFDAHNLVHLAALRNALRGMPNVSSVNSILDVPLLESPRVTFAELQAAMRTLETPGVDYALAEAELRNSPLYADMLVSRERNFTGVIVFYAPNNEYETLSRRRNELRALQIEGHLAPKDKGELQDIEKRYRVLQRQINRQNGEDVDRLRKVVEPYRAHGEIILGGLPLIVADMMDYVRSDIRVFGFGMAILLMASMAVFYRSLKWMLVSFVCCAAVAIMVSGFLGLMGWRISVISSNFMPLLLVMTLSIIIQLIGRYREEQRAFKEAGRLKPENEREIAWRAVRFMAIPCLYTSLTAMVGFASLVISDIRPVIDFGWIMFISIGLGMLVVFMLFPIFSHLVQPGLTKDEKDLTQRLTLALGEISIRYRYAMVVGFLLLVAAVGTGLTKLVVDNRFVDYFKEHTEIYRGMRAIDLYLGGTTPLDVVIDAPASAPQLVTQMEDDPFADGSDDFADPFADESDDPFAEPGTVSRPGARNLENSYWFNPYRLAQLAEIHRYVESLPETGKVMSLSTTNDVLVSLNKGKPLSAVDLQLVNSFLSNDLRDVLINPYLSDDGNQVRISARLIDSDPNLRRQELLDKIHHELVNEFGLQPQQVHLNGMAVLYNNVLQSLFESQIKTIGTAYISILFMFWLLFRSLPLAIIGIIPSAGAAVLVLGLMGWIGLPLDIMTITIAAITGGVAVEDTIHYVTRYREEFPNYRDYEATTRRCHGSIGMAMYYTSLVVIIGFSVLVLSNFYPTIYFGAFTALAMILAILLSLVILPALILIFRPRIPEMKY